MAYVPFEDVKSYVRPSDEDDVLVESLINAAEAYLKNAGIDPETTDGAEYALMVKSMVLHWYETRNSAEGDPPKDFIVRPVINQTKIISALLSNLDTC